MNFAIHIDCKACGQRLELVTAPVHHEKHLHFRCACMPADAALCVMMKALLVPSGQAAKA